MYQYSLLIGTGVLCENLYKLELSTLLYVSVNPVSSKKCLRLNEKSSTLWHKRFGRISRQIMERLIKDAILPNLDFLVFDT